MAIQAPWLIFVAYWFLAGLRVKRMKRREPAGEVLVRIILTLAAFFLLRENDPRFGVLNRRFVPWQPAVFAVGRRAHLGRRSLCHLGALLTSDKYWSGTVALRAEHQLIRTGPYARIRHPIYTGILLALAGTGLAVGRYRALVAFAIVLLASPGSPSGKRRCSRVSSAPHSKSTAAAPDFSFPGFREGVVFESFAHRSLSAGAGVWHHSCICPTGS